MPPALMQEVQEHLREMLATGVIRPSSSPFSSNVVIVRKTDGSILFCIDYRKLNSRTRKTPKPSHALTIQFICLPVQSIFSKLDLKAEERKEYQDFIERGKMMLGRGKIKQTSDDSDVEEEKLMRTRI